MQNYEKISANWIRIHSHSQLFRYGGSKLISGSQCKLCEKIQSNLYQKVKLRIGCSAFTQSLSRKKNMMPTSVIRIQIRILSTKRKGKVYFFRKSSVQIIRNNSTYHSITQERKIGRSQLAMLWIRVLKIQISNIRITWGKARIRIWIGLKMETKIWIRIKKMPIHNTGRHHMNW